MNGWILADWSVELSASVVGRANAKSASRMLSAVCNNQRLKYVFSPGCRRGLADMA